MSEASAALSDLPLRPELLQALDGLGYTRCTPVQGRALPPMLEGRDVLVQAETGSGKTAAFGLALLQGTAPDRRTQALVLCPTRELAEQVAEELRRLASRLDVQVTTLCGGRPLHPQVRALAGGAQVVVGTPGRVAKHLRKGSLELDALRVLVLDEADRMLDMGFAEEVLGIVERCPRRQTLLVSATLPEGVRELTRIQREPLVLRVSDRVDPGALRQRAYRCEPGGRKELLARLLAAERPATALVFCETRRDCEAIAAFLTGRGAVALALHGQLEQRERDDVLVQFANGSARVLVATNVAARGLDIPELPLVLVAELSPDPEVHLHRIGRTARAGATGLALSIVSGPRELERLHRIEAHLGETLERAPTPSGPASLQFLRPRYRTLLVLAGRKDKLRKGDVLGALVQSGGVPADAIGRIDLRERSCAVAVRGAYASQALKAVQSGRIKKKRVRATLLGR